MSALNGYFDQGNELNQMIHVKIAAQRKAFFEVTAQGERTVTGSPKKTKNKKTKKKNETAQKHVFLFRNVTRNRATIEVKNEQVKKTCVCFSCGCQSLFP